MRTAAQAGPNYQQMLSGAVSLLTGIALNVSRTYSSNQTEARDRIARAKVMMRENLSENLSAQEIAERLHVSLFVVSVGFPTADRNGPPRSIFSN